ncbi:MAG: hypothetical protein BGO39_20745 [Chloroflexi bacterium 54-19]|nr:MAG: hypothetical protein BGO39_20745 [Chloroflexi bacterium 54-19]
MDSFSEQISIPAQLDSWDDPVLFQDDPLKVRLKIPRDWQLERTPDRPLSFIAPARGTPPFRALVTILAQPAPPMGVGLLPLVAEQIFTTENDANMPLFQAQPTISLNLGNIPALLQRCQWQQETGGYRGQIRKTTVVTQASDRLYILCLYMNEEITEIASDVFQTILRSISFGEPEEPSLPKESVSKVLEKQREPDSGPGQTAKFVEGRWGSRQR